MHAAAPDGRVSGLLTAIDSGDKQAASELLPLVYAELRALAQRRLAAEPPGHTLQPTALVHEAYLRMVGDDDRRWNGRRHFFASAARAMRWILIERARRQKRLKNGGDRRRVSLDHAMPGNAESDVDLLMLNDALERLEAFDSRKAEIVQLRYFGGLTIDETAATLEVSPATVKSDWLFARAWLHRELSSDLGSAIEKNAPPSGQSTGERRMD